MSCKCSPLAPRTATPHYFVVMEDFRSAGQEAIVAPERDRAEIIRRLKWEHGKSDPRTHIESLSQALGMPVEYFYGPAEAPEPIEVKIKLLSPARRELLDLMADTLLRQQEEELGAFAKKA